MPGESTFIEITGRLVQGDPWVPNTRNMMGGPLTDKAGNPKSETFIAIAVPKEPLGNANAIYAAIYAKAQQDFPAGEWNTPGFSWKVEDCDAGKHAGKEWAPGCILFKLKTNYEVHCYDENSQQIVNPAELKRGCYVRVSCGVVGNGLPAGSNPGVYLNLGKYVQRVGYGVEIAGGLTFEQTFKTPVVLPPGASAVPVATGPGIAVPGQPAPMVPGQPAPGVGVAPIGMPPNPTAPAMPLQAPALPQGLPVPAPAAPVPPVAPIAAPVGVQAPVPVAPPIGPPTPAAAPLLGAIPQAAGVPMPGTVPAAPVAPPAPAGATIAPPPGFLQPGAVGPAITAVPGAVLTGYDATGQPIYGPPF